MKPDKGSFLPIMCKRLGNLFKMSGMEIDAGFRLKTVNFGVLGHVSLNLLSRGE